MADNIYVYQCGEQTYINLTNRCTNRCEFCIRNNPIGIGYDLWLKEEPTAEQVIQQLNQFPLKEVVFCGYGEPTICLDVLLRVAEYIKKQGGTVRINTNGHGNRFHNRNILPEMKGKVDVLSISLNASNRKKYEKICHCDYGEQGFDEMLSFARESVKQGFQTILSVVDTIPKEEIEACGKIAEDIGAKYRIRHYSEE